MNKSQAAGVQLLAVLYRQNMPQNVHMDEADGNPQEWIPTNHAHLWWLNQDPWQLWLITAKKNYRNRLEELGYPFVPCRYDLSIWNGHFKTACWVLADEDWNLLLAIAHNRRQDPYMLIWLGPGRRTGRRRGSVTCTDTPPKVNRVFEVIGLSLEKSVLLVFCIRWVSFCLVSIFRKKKRTKKI